MTVLNKTSRSCTNLTARGCSDQFGYYLLLNPSPNKSFHLFSFQKDVLSGILSDVVIVLRGVSLCVISPCLKQQCFRRVKLSTAGALDSPPGPSN